MEPAGLTTMRRSLGRPDRHVHDGRQPPTNPPPRNSSTCMSKVVMQASMSLDGFIADPSDDVGPLFDWYRNGDVEFTGADPGQAFHVTQASAEHLRVAWANIGASVIGRHLFDLMDGWDGNPPVADAEFVVTHEAPAAGASWVTTNSASATGGFPSQPSIRSNRCRPITEAPMFAQATRRCSALA